MARRSSSTPAESTDSTTTPSEEAAVTADAATEPTTEAPAAAATKPPEVPINLDAFNAAATKAFDSKDETSGVIGDEALAEVTKAYRDLDGVKPKNAAKAVISEHLKDAVNSLDMVTARAYMMIGEALTAGAGGSKGEKAPADPAEAYVQRVVTLALAQSLVTVPEGVDATEAAEKANAQLAELADPARSYLAWTVNESDDKGDEPEVNSTVKAAVKLATGKTAKAGGTRSGGGGGFDGPRRDIGKHIAEAFESQNSGAFLTIAEITNFKSAEYGDSKPSAGAISARLFPSTGKCTLDFVTPNTNEKGNRGATKN